MNGMLNLTQTFERGQSKFINSFDNLSKLKIIPKLNEA